MCVLSRNKKNIRIFICKLLVFGGEIFNIFEWACFCNGLLTVTLSEACSVYVVYNGYNMLYYINKLSYKRLPAFGNKGHIININ